MPQKRSSNSRSRNGSAKSKASSGKAPSRGGRKASGAAEAVVAPQARNDIAGVVFAVVAVAMLVSLVAPSSAVVTRTTAEMLRLGFGAGAVLVPVALFLFSITFFLDSEAPLSSRVALGLLLIVTSLLSMFSINVSGAESDPSLVFVPFVLEQAGGYVGGGVAWVLLTLVGRVVGMVALVGIVVAGVIVCGFSISGLVSRIRDKALAARESMLAARQLDGAGEAPAGRFGGAAKAKVPHVAGEGVAQASLFDEDGEPVTTFLGERKTSVLRRPKEEKTSRLKKRHPALDIEGEQPARPLADGDATRALGGDEGQEAVPEFLRKGQKKGKPAKGKAPASVRPGDTSDQLELPPLSILKSNPNSASSASTRGELERTSQRLQSTLEEFGLASHVVGWVSGPLVTTFKIEMGEGERVNKITNLEDDIALSLAAESVRIFAPIPGTSLVGIEIPNSKRQSVCLGDVLPYAQGGPLELAVGRDAEGAPVVADLAGMPHLLIAGATGSGKSVMINSIIMSILMRTTPDQVRLIMIDPKRVELGGYNGLPHLYVPVVTEPRQASSALQWAVTEMERRLKVFERAGAREIKAYNKMTSSGKLSQMDNPPSPMPYLVIIIDELSDLMMVAGKDVEASIVRIAQLARAAGIHLIVATQRPSADVVTGLIKSNIENRIAFSVASGTDSRVILDQNGAERLLGKGDMLFKNRRWPRPKRVLGCYVSDDEIEEAVAFIKEQGEPEYHDEILSAVAPGTPGAPAEAADEDDPLVWEAAQIVVDSQLGSTSGLQRRLKVGYARAGRIMDMLEQKGVVGPPDGSKPREVLLDGDGLEELRAAETAFREV
ncbi:MAG: DNA translocase FtsK [Atopobiaceae bacterium]|jgi:S-DNA-T family DNA segregation ATPase FtsK/SpoIIIE|nr:DNA translocase FtsK [Atopobiaceae bacterium]